MGQFRPQRVSSESWAGIRVLGSPLFFRVWVVWLGAIMLLWGVYSAHHLGWLAQPLYVLILLWFLFSKVTDVCARCQYYNQWHCGGIGKVAARFTRSLEDPIPMHRSQKHYALLFLVLLGLWVGLFNLHLMAGIASLAWTVVA